MQTLEIIVKCEILHELLYEYLYLQYYKDYIVIIFSVIAVQNWLWYMGGPSVGPGGASAPPELWNLFEYIL